MSVIINPNPMPHYGVTTPTGYRRIFPRPANPLNETTREAIEAAFETGASIAELQQIADKGDPDVAAATDLDLSTLTVPELTERAESEGIDTSGMRKADIVTALETKDES